MLLENISIKTLVCLSCGESLHPNEVAIEKVGDLKVPAKIKSAGTLFQMLACPKCQSPHLGFVPVKVINNVATPRPPLYINRDIECESGSIEVANEVEKPVVNEIESINEIEIEKIEPKKVKKLNNSINEDDFANMRKPKKRRGPPVVQKVKCTSCGEMKDVGTGFGGDFGTKCDACLKGALRDKKGN